MRVPSIEKYLRTNLVFQNNDQNRYIRSLEIEPRERYVI